MYIHPRDRLRWRVISAMAVRFWPQNRPRQSSPRPFVHGRSSPFIDRGFDAKKWDAAASHLISASDFGKPTIS